MRSLILSLSLPLQYNPHLSCTSTHISLSRPLLQIQTKPRCSCPSAVEPAARDHPATTVSVPSAQLRRAELLPPPEHHPPCARSNPDPPQHLRLTQRRRAPAHQAADQIHSLQRPAETTRTPTSPSPLQRLRSRSAHDSYLRRAANAQDLPLSSTPPADPLRLHAERRLAPTAAPLSRSSRAADYASSTPISSLLQRLRSHHRCRAPSCSSSPPSTASTTVATEIMSPPPTPLPRQLRLRRPPTSSSHDQPAFIRPPAPLRRAQI